jgi:hypothetical protein
VEVDRSASGGAPGRRFNSFVSCFEFI